VIFNFGAVLQELIVVQRYSDISPAFIMQLLKLSSFYLILELVQAIPTAVYNPTELAQAVDLKDVGLMLTNEYLPMEAGFGITTDGMRHVAASTYMRGVTSEMIEWWFGWSQNTDQYLLWHPRDHVQLDWVPPPANSTSRYIGGSHLAKEYVGGDLQSMKITFQNPSVYFGPTWKEDFAKNNYSTAICSRVAAYDAPTKDSFNIGHVIHLLHNEPDGIRMRTRFWLGAFDVPLPVGAAIAAVPEKSAKGLLKHSTEEMAILATVLPGLWREHSEEGTAGKQTGFEKLNPRGKTYQGPCGAKK
jgi:hypothetical protein